MLLISRGLVLYKLLYQASHGEILLPRLCGFHCCMPLPATSISALRFGLSVVQRLLTLKEFQMCILDLVDAFSFLHNERSLFSALESRC